MKRLALLLLLIACPLWGQEVYPPEGAGGGAPSWPLEAPSGTAAAPSYTFSDDTGSGLFYSAGPRLIGNGTSGSRYIRIDSADTGFLWLYNYGNSSSEPFATVYLDDTAVVSQANNTGSLVYGNVTVGMANVTHRINNGSTNIQAILSENGWKLEDFALTAPTCSSATRGNQWFEKPGNGEADTYEICEKAADDTYHWVPWSTGITYGKTTLTESSATDVFTVKVDQGKSIGGMIQWTVTCSSASNYAVITTTTLYSCYNEAGTEACDTVTDTGGFFAEISDGGGDFTGFAVTTTYGTDDVTFRLNATCAITQTFLEAAWKLDQNPATRGAVSVP